MKKNQYNKLIEDLNEVLIKLNIDREYLDNFAKELDEKKLESQIRIDALDDQILSKEVDLNSLQNYKTIIKKMLKDNLLVSGSISTLLLSFSALLGGLTYVLAFLPYLIGFNLLGLISFIRESKSIRKLKKNNSTLDIALNIEYLRSVKTAEKAILDYINEELASIKAKIVANDSDVSIYSDYKKQIMDRYDLASDLSFGKPSNYPDYIYYQDRRSQDVQKLVREKVEN